MSNIWGMEIDRVYQDLGKYQQLEQLITDCQLEQPDYLLVRRLDEFGHNIQNISDRLNQLESLGIKVIATEQDYNSPEWHQLDHLQLKEKLTNLLQEIQQNQRRTSLEQGHARNRLKILPPPGKAPYGYRRGQGRYIIDKSTAPVVKDFFDRFLLYGSLRGAVRYLEKRYGKKISPATGSKWLSNPAYRGSLKYKNNDIISHTHAPIINPEEAAQIDRLLRRNRRLPHRTASAPRSLAGLVTCQRCQQTMNITRVGGKRNRKEYLYLRCPQSPQKSGQKSQCRAIAYQEVLNQTIGQICAELPSAVAQLEPTDNQAIAENLKQEIARRQSIIQQLPQLLAENILDQQTTELRNYQLRTEIAQLESKIAQLPPGNLPKIAQAVSLKQFWLDLSEAERRFYFREFISKISIIRHQSKTWELELDFIF